MIGDHHHVMRYPLKAGNNTFILTPGLHDKTLYGRFHNGVAPQFPVIGCIPHTDPTVTAQADGDTATAIETRLNRLLTGGKLLEPFGGFLFCLQDMIIGPMDGPPLMTICSAVFVQTELSLDSNHLATVERRQPADTTGKDKSEKTSPVEKSNSDTPPQNELMSSHGNTRGGRARNRMVQEGGGAG